MKKVVICIVLMAFIIIGIFAYQSLKLKNATDDVRIVNNEEIKNEAIKNEEIKNEVVKNETVKNDIKTNSLDVPKSEQIGTAGSNIPLKDNMEEAEYQIKVAMQYLFEEIYGENVYDARIYVEKMYTSEDEEKNSALKEMNLGANEVAFEVRYELKPTANADINSLMIPDGEYDKESEWIKDIHRVGVLRPNDSEEPKYKITDFGTGF